MPYFCFFRFFATTYAHSSSPLLCMFQCVGLLCFFYSLFCFFFTPNALIWVLCLHVTHTLIPIFCNYFGKKVYIYTTKRHRIISSFADLTSTNYVLFFLKDIDFPRDFSHSRFRNHIHPLFLSLSPFKYMLAALALVGQY